MTDTYPPFRLDQGGEEPRPLGVDEPPLPAPVGEVGAEPAAPARRTAGRIEIVRLLNAELS
jgi:hypothetical protein